VVALATQLTLIGLPWTLRRRLLNKLFGYAISKEARIGLSIVIPFERLAMGPGARIGHLNLIRGMDAVILDPSSAIGHLNWIYGIPTYFHHLAHEPDRVAQLVLEEGAVITCRHMVDCGIGGPPSGRSGRRRPQPNYEPWDRRET